MNESLCSRLDDYLMGELDAAEHRAFQAHLSCCETCAEEVRLQAAIDRLLAAARPPAPPELERRVAAGIRRRRLRRFAAFAAAAALLLACSAAGWRFWISARAQPDDARWAQSGNETQPKSPRAPLETSPSSVPFVSVASAGDATPAAELATVDAGKTAIVVSEPSSDPTIHIFWLYPTVNVSLNAAEPSTDPAQPERNPL
jgi:anti-sigma factor RsiW